MFNLNATLGLQDVEADPNNIPDGRYDGKVLKSEYVLAKDKSKISHAITYQVTDGTFKGAQRQQWYALGTDPKTSKGGVPNTLDEVAGFTPSMTEQNKQWYKKMWADLGIDTDANPNVGPQDLVGKLVVFGVKRNSGYVNVNFVELRTEGTVTEMASSVVPQSLDASPNPFAGGDANALPSF